MNRLSDTQTTLLSTAAMRESRALLPVPDTVRAKGKALERSLAALLKRGFAEERPSPASEDESWGRDDTGRPIGLCVTEAGLAAIGIDVMAGAEGAIAAASPDQPRGKLAAVLTSIEAERGATLDELVAATDWQKHTTRAAITRLRQRGFDIRLEERDGRKAYRLVA